MGRKIIALNGPPGCGKDTIARILAQSGDFNHCENKAPMFNIALAMTGLSREEWFARYNDRSLKEVPWDRLGGKTQREFLIWISETVMKPQLGDDIFGRLSVAQVEKLQGNVVFSDGGFQAETGKLQEAFGKENVVIVHLFRKGFNFDGDSRNYVKPNGSPYLPLLLQDGDPQAAIDSIVTFLRELESNEA